MEIQTIIVLTIILTAFIYAGYLGLRKFKSFRKSSGNCGNDCGCSGKAGKISKM